VKFLGTSCSWRDRKILRTGKMKSGFCLCLCLFCWLLLLVVRISELLQRHLGLLARGCVAAALLFLWGWIWGRNSSSVLFVVGADDDADWRCGLPMLMCRWEDDTSKRFGLDSWGSVLRKGGKAAADVDTASAGDRDGIKETGEKSVMNLRACWSCLCLCGGGDNRESAKKGD